ncbi:MAG: hypothetical protein ABSH03_21815 [Candidatus Lustribacter sp.]|jgi:hypothetical protein
MKIVLLPGWHEKSDVMRTFIDGRNGIDGLAGLNETSGTWIPTDNPKKLRWKLNRRPWTIPEGHRTCSTPRPSSTICPK